VATADCSEAQEDRLVGCSEGVLVVDGTVEGSGEG